MPHLTTDGAEIYFERHGDDGEPLVLIHGYTGDITDWRHQLPEFSKTHRVLIMDHRGHGKSSAPERMQYSIEAMADDVEAVVREAGFERYHVVGHSMGGGVVQEIALRSPGRLLSLTLHDTGYRFGLTRSEIIKTFMEMRQKVAIEQGMPALAALKWPIPPPPHMPAEREAESTARLAAMSLDGFLGAAMALESWAGTKERAHQIAAPTLVICGELDRGLVEPSKWLADTIPNATLEIIPEAGHSPQYERPDLFNAALRAHLSRNAGGAAK